MSKETKAGDQKADENLWQDLLKKASRRSTQPNSTFVLVGDPKCGKTALLSRFNDRHSNQNSKEYVLDYSFVDVKNKKNSDKDEVLSHINIWQLDEPTHVDLLPLSNCLHSTVFGIAVNLSEPWTVFNSLTKWLKTIKDLTDRHLNKLPSGEATRLRANITRYMQFYVDPSVRTNEKGLSEEEKQKVALEADKPKINLGVPVIVIGCKGDTLSKFGKIKADESFDFLAKRLRKLCHEYGATLIFTSAAGKGTNVDVLQEYILHRLYNFDLDHKARVVGSHDDFAVYVPSGYDSPTLIDSASMGRWTDTTPFEEVFTNQVAKKQKATAQAVRAQENQLFFRHLSFQQSSGPSKQPKQPGGHVARAPGADLRSPVPGQAGSSVADSPPSNPAASVLNNPTIASIITGTGSGSGKGGDAAGSNAGKPAGSAGNAGANGVVTPDDAAAGKGEEKQQAVRDFFKTLLTSKGGATAVNPQNQQARANAQKALRGMSTGTAAGSTTQTTGTNKP